MNSVSVFNENTKYCINSDVACLNLQTSIFIITEIDQKIINETNQKDIITLLKREINNILKRNVWGKFVGVNVHKWI